MPVIYQRRTRTRQPTQPVGLNWSNPLTQGLVHANNFIDYRDIITGLYPTINGTDGIVPGRAGLGYKVSGVGNNLRNDNWAVGLTKDQGTIVSLWIPDDVVSSNQYLTSARNTTSGSSRYYLSCSAGQLRFGWQSTVAYTTSGVFQLGVPALASLSWGAANAPKAYLDGVLVGSATEEALVSPAVFYVGTASGATASTTGRGQTLLLLVYNRELSAEEHRALADNPWQIFEPELEVFPYIPLLGANNLRQDTTVTTGGIGQTHTLAANSLRQNTTINSGGITQAQVLTANSLRQNTTINTGAIAQTQVLAANNIRQNTTVTTGAIAQTHVLAASNVAQVNTLTGGAIVQVQTLTANNIRQDNTITGGGIAQLQVLTANNIGQATTIGTGAMAQTHVLAAFDFASVNAMTAGAIAQTHILAAGNLEQANTINSGAISAYTEIDTTAAVALGYRAVATRARYVARSAGFTIKPIKGGNP